MRRTWPEFRCASSKRRAGRACFTCLPAQSRSLSHWAHWISLQARLPSLIKMPTGCVPQTVHGQLIRPQPHTERNASMVSIQCIDSTRTGAAQGSQANWLALGIVTFVFFMWGFLTSLNDVLIPHLKSLFSLNYARSMLVQFTFFGAYFVMSLPCGKVVSRLGYKHS